MGGKRLITAPFPKSELIGYCAGPFLWNTAPKAHPINGGPSGLPAATVMIDEKSTFLQSLRAKVFVCLFVIDRPQHRIRWQVSITSSIEMACNGMFGNGEMVFSARRIARLREMAEVSSFFSFVVDVVVVVLF